MFIRTKPYNELPLLPPITDLNNSIILKTAIGANKALAEIKGISRTIPNPSILVNTLPIQEAQSSSEIENVITTTDKLYEAMISKINNYDPQTKEVLRYREALWSGFNKLKKHNLLTTNTFIEIYRTIKETDAGIRNTPGTKIQNPKGDVIYTPPEGENLVRNLLKNLEEYIHDSYDQTDPLIKMAVIHYQFEAIHPFTDGNGRTGRIINLLYLIQQDLIDLPIIYLSNYIIKNKEKYYEHLRNVTEKGEWLAWILYMLNAVEEMSKITSSKIDEINNLFERTLAEAKKNLPGRVYSKELIELLFHQPYSKVDLVVKSGIAKRQTAANYLKECERIGLLKSKKVGKEVLYLNVKLFDLLKD